jgi:IclR family transcriptional regulator, KDG regulon repressor
MVNGIERVFNLLDLLANTQNGLTNAQISRMLDIPKSTLSLILKSLLHLNCITLDTPSRIYRIGPRLLSLSRSFLHNLDIIQIGKPFLQELTNTVTESTSLCILDGLEMLLVAKQDAPVALRPFMNVGERSPIYASSGSRVILAFWKTEDIEKYLATTVLEPITKNTIVDPKKIWIEIETARNGAPLYSRGELFKDVTAISAPVFDSLGKAVASVSIRTATFNLNRERELWLESELLKVTFKFSATLGFEKSQRS